MTAPTPVALTLLVGSTREGRNADLVAPWLRAAIDADDRFALDVVDLRDWKLPLFQETAATIGDPRDPTYSVPLVKAWNERIATGEAFLVLTTEYNHSIPGELKNAVDSLFASSGLRNKPVGFVGYSVAATGAVRAVEHLVQAVRNQEAIPLRNGVLIGNVTTAFAEGGRPADPMTDAALEVLLDDLDWWGRLLNRARADGELLPGMVRLRRAMAARTPG